MRALVLCNNPVFALGIVRSLGAVGARAYVMGDRRVTRARFSRYCAQQIHVTASELGSSVAMIRRINDACARHDIDIIIAGDMAWTFLVAEIRAALFVPLFPVTELELLRTLHDKERFWQLLTRLELPTPRTQVLEPGESLDAISFGYPLMVKPTNSEGGDRVHRCDSRVELETLLAAPEARQQPWLLQEFVPGRDIDLSLLADRGRVIAWTIQDDSDGGQKMFKPEPRLLAIGERLVAATGFHGVAHFDMRIDARDGRVLVIECNPRFWGSLILSTWSGVNFVALGCALALGQPIAPASQLDGPSQHQGPAPRRLLKALLDGRTAPAGLTGSMLAGWKQVHADPLPELIGVHAEDFHRKAGAVASPVAIALGNVLDLLELLG